METMRKERIDRGVRVRASGLYAISSWREMLYLMGPPLALIIGVILLPVILELAPYWKRVINIMCVYALLALSFDFLANYVGLVCLGGAFFVGVGGYLSAIFNVYLHFPVYLSIPLATICGAFICTFLLMPCLPLRGVYFAIVTLMYPLLATRVIEALDILGGTNGITGLDSLPNEYVEHYAIILMTLFFLYAMRRFVNQDVGLVIRGVKDNDQAVKASGISVTKMKAFAVCIAAFMGCFGGAYMSHMYMWSGLSMFALDFSIIPMASVVIGGGWNSIGCNYWQFHTGSPFGGSQKFWHFQNSHLLCPSHRIYCVQERGNNGVRDEEIPPI